MEVPLNQTCQVPQGIKCLNHIHPDDAIDIPEPFLCQPRRRYFRNNKSCIYPDIVRSLLKLARQASDDIGDYGRAGTGARCFDTYPIRPDAEKWASKQL